MEGKSANSTFVERTVVGGSLSTLSLVHMLLHLFLEMALLRLANLKLNGGRNSQPGLILFVSASVVLPSSVVVVVVLAHSQSFRFR